MRNITNFPRFTIFQGGMFGVFFNIFLDIVASITKGISRVKAESQVTTAVVKTSELNKCQTAQISQGAD